MSEEYTVTNDSQLKIADEEIARLRKQLDESNRKLEQRIAMEIDEHLKVVSLQAKLDIAVEALKNVNKHADWGVNWIIMITTEALKKLEA